MPIAAGRFRHYGSLQRFVETRDANGNRSKAWVEIGKVWAAIEPFSGRELIAAAQIASKVSTRVVIRYRDGIVPPMRFVHRNTLYDIIAVMPDKDAGIEYLTLMCTAGANSG